MTFVVEDGTGKADAVSLCSLEYADAYFELRKIASWTGGDAAKEAALVRATDYFMLRWDAQLIGERQFPDVQALSFPRLYIDADDAVPEAVLRSVAEYALCTVGGTPLVPSPTVDATGMALQRKRTKVGPLETETEFQTGASTQRFNRYTVADTYARKYVVASAGVVR